MTSTPVPDLKKFGESQLEAFKYLFTKIGELEQQIHMLNTRIEQLEDST